MRSTVDQAIDKSVNGNSHLGEVRAIWGKWLDRADNTYIPGYGFKLIVRQHENGFSQTLFKNVSRNMQTGLPSRIHHRLEAIWHKDFKAMQISFAEIVNEEYNPTAREITEAVLYLKEKDRELKQLREKCDDSIPAWVEAAKKKIALGKSKRRTRAASKSNAKLLRKTKKSAGRRKGKLSRKTKTR